jgi:hypothetical protein
VAQQPVAKPHHLRFDGLAQAEDQRRREEKVRHLPPQKRVVPKIDEKLKSWDTDFLLQAQLDDPDIAPVIAWCNGMGRSPWREMGGHSPFTKALWRQFLSLVLIEVYCIERFIN